VGVEEHICYCARIDIHAQDDAMIPASVRQIPARAFLPAGGVFVTFSLVPLGLLTAGPIFLDGTAAARFLVPLFALIFIVMLSMACAVFTLYQETFFTRFPGLRRIMVLGSFTLGIGLVLLLRHADIQREVLFVPASANLVVFALLLGNFLATGLTRPSELVPVCSVMSVADLLSVFAGPSKQMVEGIDVFYRDGRVGPVPWSDFLLVKIAVPGVDHLVPVFGVADVVILAFLVAAAHKFRLDDNLLGRALAEVQGRRCLARWFPAAGAGLFLALLAAHSFNLFIPALPVMAVLFLGYTLPRHPKMRMLRSSEWVVVIVCLALLSGWAIRS
jgi:hypothetical protein